MRKKVRTHPKNFFWTFFHGINWFINDFSMKYKGEKKGEKKGENSPQKFFWTKIIVLKSLMGKNKGNINVNLFFLLVIND